MQKKKKKKKKKVRVTTCMAWGGALASLRWIIQGKHMEVTNCMYIPAVLLYVFCSLNLGGHFFFHSCDIHNW